jgi:G3E family GTPase
VSRRPQPSRRDVPLTVLTGFDRAGVSDIAAGILLRTDRVALVWADPFTAELGYVQTRVTDSDGRCTEQTVELEHGCLSCAMREATVRAIRALCRTGRYDSVIVHLHPGIEADAAVLALDHELRGEAHVDTVATVLHEGWLDDLGDDYDVAAKGIAVAPADERSAAMVLGSALDTASVLVLPGPVRDALNLEQHACLSVLCPQILRVYPTTCLDVSPEAVLGTGTYDAGTRTLFAERGLLDPARELPAITGGIRLVRWQQRDRPLHPHRLRDALDSLADGVIRSTGALWVATHDEHAVHWYSAGDCLTLGPAGPWPRPDRYTHLAFLGDELDAEHVRDVLDACVLTDAEFALGPTGWALLDDPFVEWRCSGDQPDDEVGAA